MIASWAAQGLAKLQDPRAIDVLIEAGRRAPAEARVGIVQALVYFSQDRAQKAADQLVERWPENEKKIVEVFRGQRAERGLRALFPW